MSLGNLSPLAESSNMKVLNIGSMNPDIKRVEYAVRGEIAIRAEQLRQQLEKKPGSLPFTNVINSNIGNPQQLGQKPITFFRRVASLVEQPDVLNDPSRQEELAAVYAPDEIERARLMLEFAGNVGAYSHSQGISAIRERVAKFIADRDGHPADPSHIFLTNGASAGVQMSLQSLIGHPNCGILIPIPQYPLYTASLALYNGKPVPYYLNEEKSWGIEQHSLLEPLLKARSEGTDVRAIVIINPGNPTGQVLPRDDMEMVVDFCKRHRLVLLADEVYQANVYEPEKAPFVSFKKVLKDMGPDYESVELISFHSISKGMIGECGRRGGYLELVGIDPSVVEQLYKLASVSLCPNVQGQIMVDLMTNPPKVGDPSYELYRKEYDSIYQSLQRRSRKLAKVFAEMEGVTCNDAQGSMYLFPRIRLPENAIEAAKAAGKAPDAFYCMAMLEATGVCVIPGSGFGQAPGTFHFRTTFLPLEEHYDAFCELLRKFHRNFMDRYRD